MRLQVTLALLCVLVPKALTLKCLQCLPVQFGTCTDTQVDCSDQCAYATALVSMGGKPKSVYLKTCATAAECVTGSVNLGIINMTIRSQCCSTALCNNQTLTALESLPPNGKTCYTCTLDNNCTKTVNCEGDADQCVTVKATFAGAALNLKGCASKSLSSVIGPIMQAAGVTGSVTSCSGDMCNSAAGVKLSLLIVLVSLLSSILLLFL